MKVYYKRLIEGVTTHAIIHNGSYFLIDMPVYEDGTIDCWERVPFDEIPGQLKKGWLVTSVPDGESISIDGLGNFVIKNSSWNYTPRSYEKHIGEIVKSMNNNRAGLFQETREKKKLWKEHRVKWRAQGTPYKIAGDFGYTMLDGSVTKMFLQKENVYHLVSITGFADGAYQIENESITFQEIAGMIEQKLLICSPPLGAKVKINDLGIIEISSVAWAADPSEKLKEILDLAGNKETAHERCVALYHEYLEYPNETTRILLREAYEAVPEHERMYLGDMDSKDSDYRRIIFEPHKKREV